MTINEIVLLCSFANNIHFKKLYKKVLVLSHKMNVKIENNTLTLHNTL